MKRLTRTRWPTSRVGSIDSEGIWYGLTMKAWIPSARPRASTTMTTSSTSPPRAVFGYRSGDQLLVDSPAALGNSRRLADASAQVVELGAAYVPAPGDLEPLDLRRMQGESPLHSDPEGLLAHGEGLTRAGALPLQHDPLEDLGAAPAALDHLEVDPDAIAGAEGGNPLLELAPLDAVDDAAHSRRKTAQLPWRARAVARMVATPGRRRGARRARRSA